MANLLLDFDGTLVDCSRRLHALFVELTGDGSFSYDEYWQIKRQRVDQATLLRQRYGYSKEQVDNFKKLWLNKVEEPSRLALDQPFAGVTELLSDLAERHALHIVTARQNALLIGEQIAHFGWTDMLANVLVTAHSTTKYDLVRRAFECDPNDVFVGDTGEDIQTAKKLGVRSVAVSSGFLNGDVLKQYEPQFIIPTILEIYETGIV